MTIRKGSGGGARLRPGQDCKSLFTELIADADEGSLIGAVVTLAYLHHEPHDRRRHRRYEVALCGWASQDYDMAAQMAARGWFRIQGTLAEEDEQDG